ncbi:MAG: spore germination protein [Oscillospiraceae bacterium]|nr:spore germination protein [Oscillospiraceae bacterium]
MSENVYTAIPPELPLEKSLKKNLDHLKAITGGSSDVIIKTGSLCGSDIAVITCEGMASTDTLAQLVYEKLNDVGNSEKLPPEEIMERLFKDYLIAAEQLEINNIGDLTLKMQSGFAIILVEGCARGIAVGIQGYAARGVDEPSGELNVRGSREGFVEVIRKNMALIRRRIKSPTLVFEMLVIGERSNTDICLCYLSDKVSPKLLEDVKKRLKSVKLNTILESGYLQPFFEGKGGWFFSECGTCERPDSFAAKLYEGRVGILVDGTPFALTVPYLFIENFQTLDDYTQKPFYAAFIRLVRLAAYLITLFLPGAYVAVASYNPEMLPSSLILNLAAAEQTAPYSLMAECLLIHFMYEILREAGIRLPRPIGHAIGVVGGIVIGDITVNAGLVGAPMVLIVALSGLCSFVVPALYERTVVLRFIYILAGGIFGLFGLLLAAGVIIIKMCSLNTYGVPYMAPFSPFSPRSSRDMLVRAGWRRLQKGDVTIQGLNGSNIHAD